MVNAIPNSYAISVHSSCICNELVALHNRHLVKRDIKFNPSKFRASALRLRKLFPSHYDPITTTHFINRYSGPKKQAYRRAYYNLSVGGLQKKHTKVSMFVKPDRFPQEVIEEKPPRAIQFRSQEFNLVWGTMLEPIEKWTYNELKLGVSKTPIIAKGLNPYQRAELLIEKASYFNDPIYLLVDHSKFDSTINVYHLKMTHSIYAKAYKSRLFYMCCKAQLFNKGYSKSGIQYEIKGTRMSGDYDTGLGNCIVNIIAITGVLYDSAISNFDMLIDGDDSIIIVERHDLKKFDYDLFEQYGFQTKFSYVDNISEAEFCQSKLVLADRPVFVRNPRRIWSHANCTLKQYKGNAINEWISGVGLCELSLNQGVPVIQSMGYSYFRHYRKFRMDDDYHRKMVSVDIKKTQKPISYLARLSFEVAWGIPVWLQEKMEQYDWTSRAYKNYLTKKFKYKDYVKTAASVRTSSSSFRALDTNSGAGWWAVSS